jgi:hypothetical protein
MGRKKQKKTTGGSARERFEVQANQQGAGLIAEFWEFFRTNKKWWMVPIVVVLLILAGLVLLGGTALAPFIYTMF